jgi:hypothetical protein
MAQFLLVLAAVLLLVASIVQRPSSAPYPLLPHLGWFGLFLYVLVAALGAFGIGR